LNGSRDVAMWVSGRQVAKLRGGGSTS
jgi:hypothetical protein